MEKNSITINNPALKKTIAIEVARQQSFLIGVFEKPKVPGLIINQWAVASVSNPNFLKLVAEEMTKIINELGKVDLICGIETAGIGLAAAISLTSKKPWIYARKERKKYGSLEAFEGTYYQGARVIFIDNMSARGKGLPEILENAAAEKFIFDSQIVIVDNDWEKIDEVKNYNLKTYSLITTQELIEELNKLHYFPGNLYSYMIDYVKEPQKWEKKSSIVKNFIEELHKTPDLPYIKKPKTK